MFRRSLLAATLPWPALAQGEVNRLVVAYPPGAAADGISRLLADAAGRGPLGSTVVENRPGANGNIAAAAVARARPDGRTLLVTLDTTFTVGPHIFPSLGFDPAALEHVALIGSFPLALLVHPGTGIGDLMGFAAAARHRSLLYVSGGVGSPGHLGMEALRLRLGLPPTALEHVPQRGNAEALTELLSGRVQAAMVATGGGGRQMVEEGHLRALATSGEHRDPALPGTATLAEAGLSGLVIRFGYILSVPRGTPEVRKQAWLSLARQVFAEPGPHLQIERFGVWPEVHEGVEAVAWIAGNYDRWGQVARAAGMRTG